MSDSSKASAAPLNIGRYQVTDRLGEGGMGIVYLARDTSLERFVAIKLMRAGFDTAELRGRFVKEARAVASLRHPCIVTLYEYGDYEGQPFIVMEYVNGKTLLDLIGSGTPMSLARRMQLTRDICLGLEHAHKAGIIHRDIKPANIMVDSEGTLKILDFGIAKLGHAGTTQISSLVGTPRYMSPEQISGKPVTRRSDIFSVGLVVYELLASRPAYASGSQYAVMDAILHSEPIPLATHVPTLDPRIIRIVDKALEKDPDRRYQDLAQMRREVERICNELALADPQQSTTLVQSPRPSAQLDDLARRRTQQIEANLENAERAFEIGDYDAGLAACEDALIIDPQETRALEGLQRAQAALTERQAFAYLNAARQHFAKDELTQAEDALRAASALAPALHEVLDLHEQVGSARQKQEQRTRALKLALDRARIRFGEGAFESAVNAANEALEYNPNDTEARRLKAEALAGFKDDQRRREVDRQAQRAVDAATHLAARDRYDEALQALTDSAIVSHPLIHEARARIESARGEFDRLTTEANARRETARLEAARAEAVRVEAARHEAAQHEAARHEAARHEAARHEAARAEAQRLVAEKAEAARLQASELAARQLVEVSTLVAPPSPPPDLTDDRTHATPIPRPAPTTDPAAAIEPSQPDTRGWLLLSLTGSVGVLPGPVRRRRPRPIRRPVQFVDAATDRGGAREWFHDQLFVGAKQGHDSFGFGVSTTTHIVVVVAAIGAILSRAPIPVPPQERPPLVMLTTALPNPPMPDSTPPRPLRSPEKQRPRTDAPRQTETQPIASAPPPVDTPFTAPLTLPAKDSPTASTPAVVEPVTSAQPGPPLAANPLDTPSEIPVNDFDQDPVLVKNVKPKFPEGASGAFRVEVTILANGRVSRVRMLDVTPFADLIMEAAEQCVFRPAKKRGRAVTVEFVLTFQAIARK